MASISNAKRGKPKANKNSTKYDSAGESELCDATLSLTRQIASDVFKNILNILRIVMAEHITTEVNMYW